MQSCLNCHQDSPDEARFCMHCGTSLAGSYTPKHLQSSVFEKTQALGERKQVTVLFADIQHSLDLSRAVGAEVWHGILDRFFAILSDSVHSYEGTVNQYTGDGVMALFGAPVAFEDHAKRGCLAALSIKSQVSGLADNLRDEFGIEFAVRVGLNSGEVVVGRIGDDLRRDYTAQGDTVAIAARMESIARGGRIYVAQATVNLVEGLFEWKDRGKRQLSRSTSQPLQVFELRREVAQRRRFDVLREKGMPTMVGRDHEFWQLKRKINDLSSSGGGLVALRGETGSGKSRLTYEVARYADAQQVPVLELRGRSDHKAAPLQPYADLLRAIFGISVDSDAKRARRRLRFGFNRLCPECDWEPDYSVLLGLLGYEATSERLSGEEFAQAVTDTLAHLITKGMNRPLLFVVENLHLLDHHEDTAHLLSLLANQVASSNTLLVITYRSDYRPPWPKEAGEEFDLKPLNREQLAELLAASLKAEQPQLKLADALLVPSSGNPMFAQELLRSLQHGNQLKHRDGQYLVARDADLKLPPSVQSAIAERVDALPNAAKQLLQLAAVAGPQFDVRLLSKASELGPAGVTRQLELLVDYEFVYCVTEQPQIVYAFYQAVVRDVVYGALLAEQREAAHAALAAAITSQTSLGAEAAGTAAYHFAEAHDWLPAARNQDKAAIWYFERAPDEAARRWEQALEWLRLLPTDQERVQLQAGSVRLQILMRLIIHSGSRGFDRTKLPAYVAEAHDLLGDSPAPRDEASLLISTGASELFFGDLRRSREHYLTAIALLEPGANSHDAEGGLLLVAMAGVVMANVQLGCLDECIAKAREALAFADGDTDAGAQVLGRSPTINLLAMQAWAFIEKGQPAQAEPLLQECLPLAIARDEPENRLLAQMLLMRIQVERGNTEAVFDELMDLLEAAVQCGNTLILTAAYRISAAAAADKNDWVVASQYLEKARQLIDQHGAAINQLPSIMSLQSHVELGLGRARDAMNQAVSGAELAKQAGTRIAEAECWLIWVAASLSRRSFASHRGAIEEKMSRCRQLIDETGADALLPRWHRIAAELARRDGRESQRRAELHESAEGWKRLGNIERFNEAKNELAAAQQR